MRAAVVVVLLAACDSKGLTKKVDDLNPADSLCFGHLFRTTLCQLEAAENDNKCMQCLFRHEIMFEMDKYRCTPAAIQAFCSAAQYADASITTGPQEQKGARALDNEEWKDAKSEEAIYALKRPGKKPTREIKSEIVQASNQLDNQNTKFAKKNKKELHKDKGAMEAALLGYEQSYNMMEVDHPKYLGAQANVEDKFMSGIGTKFATAIGEPRNDKDNAYHLENKWSLAQAESKAAGKTVKPETLHLKAAFFGGWKKWLLGEKGHGNLAGKINKHHHYFRMVPPTRMPTKAPTIGLTRPDPSVETRKDDDDDMARNNPDHVFNKSLKQEQKNVGEGEGDGDGGGNGNHGNGDGDGDGSQ